MTQIKKSRTWHLTRNFIVKTSELLVTCKTLTHLPHLCQEQLIIDLFCTRPPHACLILTREVLKGFQNINPPCNPSVETNHSAAEITDFFETLNSRLHIKHWHSINKNDLTCSGWAEPSLVWRRASAIPAAPELWGAVWRSRFRARSGSFVGWEHDCCQDDSFCDRSSLTWVIFKSTKRENHNNV